MKKQNFRRDRAKYFRHLKFERLEVRALLSGNMNDNPVTDSCELETSVADNIGNGKTVQELNWYTLSTNINPSSEEQELLEQINRFRTDPQGELSRIFSSISNEQLVARNSKVQQAVDLYSYPKDSIESFLNEWNTIIPVAPLAFNSSLISAAVSHTAYMCKKNDISHTCSGEKELLTRLSNSGFSFGVTDEDQSPVYGENVGGGFSANLGNTSEIFSVASYMLAAFAVDWGASTHLHRDTMVNASYSEVGISIVQTNKSIGPYVTTCDFGTSQQGARSDGAYLLGVVYDDLDGDLFYDSESASINGVGEGMKDVNIVVTRLDGSEQSVSFSSWDSGGYQIFLLNGSYSITVSDDCFSSSVTKFITINDGNNVKLDFRLQDISAIAPVISITSKPSEDYTAVFIEGAEEPSIILSDGVLTIADSDSYFLYGAKIYFGNRPDGLRETLDLSLCDTNLQATFEQQAGVITISGVGSLEEYKLVIQTLSYFNSCDECDLSIRSIMISVFDGIFWSEDIEIPLVIQATNLPQLTVQDLRVYEGDSETKLTNFVVKLDSPARLDVTFEFEVALGGNALEGDSFNILTDSTITIVAGETSATIECEIVGNYDALRPNGLQKLFDGSYENPFSCFYLAIKNVQNAYLTNEEGLVKATIFDDDSSILLGRATQFSTTSTLMTEKGSRRYIFQVTAPSDGYYVWNIGSQNPDSVISVYRDELCSEPIVRSIPSEKGCKAQWSVEKDYEYFIVVESVSDIFLVEGCMLEIVDGDTILVEPDLENTEVNLSLNDNGGELAWGDFSWSLSKDGKDCLTLQTSRGDLEFKYYLNSTSSGSISLEQNDASILSLDSDAISEIRTVGFSTHIYYGQKSSENLTIMGTYGSDYLYFSQGDGYFRASSGNFHYFYGVNSVTIDGCGGNDEAYIEDSDFNDRLETANDFIALYGGGVSLKVWNFGETRVNFNNGGDDVYYALDSGDDVQAVVSGASSILSGTFNPNSSSNALLSNTVLDYVRIVTGVEQTILKPVELLGSAFWYADDSVETSVNLSVGSLAVLSRGTETTTIVGAKSLSILDGERLIGDYLEVLTPDDCVILVDGVNTKITDSLSGWYFVLPTAKINKNILSDCDEKSSLEKKREEELDLQIDTIFPSLDVISIIEASQSEEGEIRGFNEVFANWEDEETCGIEMDSISRSNEISVERFSTEKDVFDVLWSITGTYSKRKSIFLN